jgi:hypothetical protein
MTDIADPSETAQSLKRLLDLAQAPQPIHLDDSAATNPDRLERDELAGATDAHRLASDFVEPAAKRVKLANGEPEAPSPKVDARDKVKGVALVKEE